MPSSSLFEIEVEVGVLDEVEATFTTFTGGWMGGWGGVGKLRLELTSAMSS